MAGPKGKGEKGKKAGTAQSTTKATATNGCCPDCAGKPSGTMGACEDDTCRHIPPPQGTGPWVLYWHPNINQNFPYWESVANILAAFTAAAAQAAGAGEQTTM